MAFNINAQVILSGPKNIKAVTKSIKSQLSGLTATVNIKIPQGTGRSITALNKHLTSLNANLSTLNKTSSTTNNTLRSLGSNLSGVAKGTQSLARAQKNVGTSLKNVNKQVSQATSGIQKFGNEAAQAIKRFAGFTIATSTIYGFIRSIQSATKNALDFQRELVKLQQVTGQGGKALQSIRKEVESLSVSLGIDANKLLQIGRIFAQTGQTLNQVEKSLQAVARSSLAPTFGTMESTAEGLVAALAQFNIQAKDSEKVLGSLNAVSKKFAVESGDLISAIRRAGGVFSATAFQMKDPIDSLNELIGVFTAVRSTTRESADTIATGLRTIFTRIQRPRTIKFLREFGIELVDLKGNFKGIFPALQQISQGLDSIIQRGDTLTLARITEELGGIRQVGKLIPALRNFDKALKAVEVAGKGAAEGLGKDVALALQPLSKQFERLQARFGDLVREISRSATFQNLARLAINTANAFITMADALRPLIPLVTSLAAVKITRGIFDFGSGFLGGLKGGSRGGLGKRAASAVTGAGARQQAASQQQTASSMKTLASAQQQSTRATQSLARILGTYQQGLSANTSALNRVSTTNSNLFTNLATLSRRIDTLTAAIGRASGNVISGGGGGSRGVSGSRARRPRRGRAAGGRIRRQRGGPIPHDYVGVFLQDETSSMGRNVPFDPRQSKSTQQRSADLSQGAIRAKLSKSQKGELGKVRQLQLGPKSKAKETSLLASTLGIQQGSGLGKINPNNQFRYTLHNASLTSDTNKNIFRSIRANVVRGIQRGARKAQKQTGARTLRSVDDSLLKQIGFPNIAGRMFEGVLSRMGVPFDKNRDPGADLDFPGGLGALGRAFGVSGTYPGDAKIKYTQAAIESLDKKVKNFIISRFQTEAFMPTGKGVAARPPRSKYLAYGKSFQANAIKYQGTQGGVSQGLVPALLTPGELVFNPQGVREAGVRNLDKFNNTGNVRDIISNVNPNNVSVVPGVGSGDTYPADLEPGSYVVKKRSSRNYTGGVFGNIQTAAHGGIIGRQRFNGGSFGGVSPLSRTVKLDDIASSTQKAFDKNRRAVNKNTQSIHRGTQANQDLQSGAAGAVAALVGLGASISTLDFSSVEAGTASLTNLALIGSFLIPQLKGLGGVVSGVVKRGTKSLGSVTRIGAAAKGSTRRLREVAAGGGPGARRATQSLGKLSPLKRTLGLRTGLAGRAALGAKAGVAGLVTALVADPIIDFLGSKKFGEKQEIAPGVRGIEGRTKDQAETQARILESFKGAVSGAGFGASIGAVIAGPVGAAVGGVIGGIAGVVSAQIFGPKMEVARQKEFDAFIALGNASDNVSKKFGELTRAGQQLTTAQLAAGSKSLADQATAVDEAQRLGVARRKSDEEGGLLGGFSSLVSGGNLKTGSQLLNFVTGGFFGENQGQTKRRRQREATRAAVSRITPEQAAAATEVANNANLQLINSIGNLNPELLKTVAATGNLDVALQSADAPTRRFAAALEDMQKKALATNVISKATAQLKDLGEGVEADKLTDDIAQVKAAFKDGVPLAEIKAGLADSKTAMLGIVEEEQRLQKSYKQSAATSKLLAVESAKAAAQLDTMISAFDQFGTAISQTMGKMSDAIDRANVSVEAISQTTTQIAAISKKGVFENLETASPREISGAIADIRSFAPGVQGNPFKDVESILRAQTRLPDVLRGVVANVARSQAKGLLVGTGKEQVIQQGAQVGNAIAAGLRAEGIVLPEKLLNKLQAELGQQFSRQGGGKDIGELLTSEAGLNRLKGIIIEFSETVRNSMQEGEKGAQEFRNGLIKAANLQLNLTRQQISSQLKINQKQFDIQDRINNVLGRTAKPGAAADRLRTQLGTILGRPSFANAGIRTVNLSGRGTTGDLIVQRQELEQQRRSLEQAKETPILVNQLRVNAEALERNKRATELLANDVSVLSELEARAAKFAQREQAARAGIVGFSQAVDELVMGLRSGDRDQFQRGMASFTDFVSPMRSLVLASQGRGGLLNNDQLRTLIGAISSGDARIATLLEQLPGGQEQAQAIQRNLTLGLAQRTFNQLLAVGGQPGDFADFVPIFAQELQKSINARKPIAQQIAEVGRVQIKLQEASMKRITEETVKQLRAVYQQLSIALTSFSASVADLARRRGIPQARKGGLVRGPSHSQGGVLAELEGGEIVIPKMVGGGALRASRHGRRYSTRRRQKLAMAALEQLLTPSSVSHLREQQNTRGRSQGGYFGPGTMHSRLYNAGSRLAAQFPDPRRRPPRRFVGSTVGQAGPMDFDAYQRQQRERMHRGAAARYDARRAPSAPRKTTLAEDQLAILKRDNPAFFAPAGTYGPQPRPSVATRLSPRQQMLQRNRAAYEKRKAARAQRPRVSRRYRAALLRQQRFQESQKFLYDARNTYRKRAQGFDLEDDEIRNLVQARAMLRRRRRFGNGGMVELEGGEYIINKRSAAAIGTSNLNRLNSMRNGGAIGNLKDLDEKGMRLPERNKQTAILEKLKSNSTTSLKQEKSQGLALNVLRDDMGSVKRAALTQGSIFTHDTGTHKRLDSLIPALRSITVSIHGLKDKLGGGPLGPLIHGLGGAPGGGMRDDPMRPLPDMDEGLMVERGKEVRDARRVINRGRVMRGRGMGRFGPRPERPDRMMRRWFPDAGPDEDEKFQQDLEDFFNKEFPPMEFANGGFVRGPSHAQGGVPALLEGGEYVIPKRFFNGGPVYDFGGTGQTEGLIQRRERSGLFKWGDHFQDIVEYMTGYRGTDAGGVGVKPRDRTPQPGVYTGAPPEMLVGGKGIIKGIKKIPSLWQRFKGLFKRKPKAPKPWTAGLSQRALLNIFRGEERAFGRYAGSQYHGLSRITGRQKWQDKYRNITEAEHQLILDYMKEWQRPGGTGFGPVRSVSMMPMNNRHDLIYDTINQMIRNGQHPSKWTKKDYDKMFSSVDSTLFYDFIEKNVTLGGGARPPGGGISSLGPPPLSATRPDTGSATPRSIGTILDNLLAHGPRQGAPPRPHFFEKMTNEEIQKWMQSAPEGSREWFKNVYEVISWRMGRLAKITDPKLKRSRRYKSPREMFAEHVKKTGIEYTQEAYEEFVRKTQSQYWQTIDPVTRPPTNFGAVPKHYDQGFANGGLVGMGMGDFIRGGKKAWSGIKWAGSKLAKFFGGGGKKGISNPRSRYRTLGVGTKENRGMIQKQKHFPFDESNIRTPNRYQKQFDFTLDEAADDLFKAMGPYKSVPRQSQKNWGAYPKHWDQGLANGGLVQYRALGGIMDPIAGMRNLINQMLGMGSGLFGGMKAMGQGARQGAFGGVQNLISSLFGPRKSGHAFDWMGGPGTIGDVMEAAREFFFGWGANGVRLGGGGAGMLDFIKGGGLGGSVSHFGTSPMYTTPFGPGASFTGPMFFSQGGGPRGSDTVPAWLTPGEFVMRKSAVDKYGVEQMEKINKGSVHMNQGGPVRYMAAGGSVGPGQGGFPDIDLATINALNNTLGNLERALQNMPTVPEGIDLNLRGESFIRMASDSNITEKFKEEFTANYLEAIKGPQGTRPDGSRPDPTISRLI